MAEELGIQPNKRKKIIWLIILLLFLLIIAAIIYLLLNYFQIPLPGETNLNANLNQGVTAVPETPAMPGTFNQANSGILADVKAINGEQPAVNEETTEAVLVSEAFAERFGSYSNQSDYQNLQDLEIFMTQSMSNWIKTYRDDLRKQNPDLNVYYAIETKAISTKVNSLDEKNGQAELVIKTQRQEFKEDINTPRVFYQDILLQLVKVNNQWKVNGAYWQ